ncbi:unnamed protein product, partial [Ceratitis capitata]
MLQQADRLRWLRRPARAASTHCRSNQQTVTKCKRQSFSPPIAHSLGKRGGIFATLAFIRFPFAVRSFVVKRQFLLQLQKPQFRTAVGMRSAWVAQ